MNGKMWMHPATQANVETLKSRESNSSGPRKACLPAATRGWGVSGTWMTLCNAPGKILAARKRTVKFLITAGPTREPIDPVRFISNRSSGKMGYAIADAAVKAGHDVILISGPVCLAPPRGGASSSKSRTSDEMHDAVHAGLKGVDIIVMCAAVADFKPANYSPDKIKKHRGLDKISLAPTRDILSSLTKVKNNFLVAGFAAETESLRENALKKLREKKCDLIIGNDASRMDAGMESDFNEITLFYKSGEVEAIPRAKKTALAKKLVAIFEKLQEKS